MAVKTDISRYIFSEKKFRIYAILDGAAIPELRTKLFELKPEYVCLYRGELPPDIAQVAPYLVQFEPNSKFSEWVFSKGWGNHWGIFVRSNYNLRILRKHFRSFLIVHNEDGKPLLFRYYDPRVFRVYLPTCNKEEVEKVFGPVDSFFMEDEDADTLIRFRKIDGVLKKETREFTSVEEEELAREAAEREKRRQELMPTKQAEQKDDPMQHSLVNFWTTMNKFKLDDEDE